MTDKSLVPMEQKQMAIRTVAGNVALGAAGGAAAGVTVGVLTQSAYRTSTYIYPIGGDLATVGAIALVLAIMAAAVIAWRHSTKRQHTRTKAALKRVAELRQEELISQHDYDTLKARLLARYAQPDDGIMVHRMTHAAKLAGAVGLGTGMMLRAADLASYGFGTPLYLVYGLIGAGLGAVAILLLSVIYRAVIVGDTPRLHAGESHQQLSQGETRYEPLG